MSGASAIVVTGAARGIGAAIAERFVRDGWHAILADMNPKVIETAQRLCVQRPGAASGHVVDVASEDGRQELVEAVRARCVPLRALVNNAGITRDALLRKMTEEQFRTVLRVNLGAAHALTLRLVEELAGDGVVVNLSSKSASGNVGQYNYAVSKAGLIGMTRSLALTLAPRLRVNAIAPAFIATEMTDAIPDDLRERFIAKIPLGRAGRPAEIADAVHWLASPAASYVTGEVLAVCGGRSFGPGR